MPGVYFYKQSISELYKIETLISKIKYGLEPHLKQKLTKLLKIVDGRSQERPEDSLFNSYNT